MRTSVAFAKLIQARKYERENILKIRLKMIKIIKNFKLVTVRMKILYFVTEDTFVAS